MAEIKLADVAKLRKMTMAGMMDCKNALAEADGDMERAVEIIREKGKLVASKRADRNATEGVVVSRVVNGTKAYMLCLACETDFVAKTEGFVQAANEILEIAVKNDVADLESLLATKAGDRTVADLVSEKSGQTGEKVELPFYGRIEAPLLRGVCAHQPQGRFAHRVQQGGTGRARTRCRHAGYRHGPRGYRRGALPEGGD